MRYLYTVHRRLSDCGNCAFGGGFAALHFVLHDRIARGGAGRAPGGNRAATFSDATFARMCARGIGALRSRRIRRTKRVRIAPALEKLAALSEVEFRALFRGTPVSRTRYSGFLRNVAIAMGNARLREVSRAAREAGRIERPAGRRACTLGAQPTTIKEVRILLPLVLASALLFAQDPAVEKATTHFYNLEYDQAMAEFGQAMARHPDDPELHNHLAQSHRGPGNVPQWRPRK